MKKCGPKHMAIIFTGIYPANAVTPPMVYFHTAENN